MAKHPFLLIFSVILPFITLLIEFISGMSAEVYVNPMPTAWHALLIGLVPAANLYALVGLAKPERSSYRSLFWANGIALGISSIYAMAFLPISPFSCIAILFWGLGFLSLSPVLAFFATVVIAAILHRQAFNGEQPTAGRHVWLTTFAVLLGWALFLCGDLPLVLTRESLALALSRDESSQKTGLWLLRTIGSESELLRVSNQDKGDIRPTSWTYHPVGESEIRQVFYQATGRSIDQEPLGRLADRQRGWFWNNDSALGGESVSGHRRYLFLDESAMEVTVDPDNLLTYTEWTMEFQNNNRWAEEARTQIRLPADGVVSRLTLWVNGEPREAAFAATPKVRAAYQEVAVVQRCDPVLVTWKGTDRIFMQCFPVPAEGRMKLRVGVTAPMEFDGARPSVRLPHLTEQNFSNSRRMKHSVQARSIDETPLAGSDDSNSAPAKELQWRIGDEQLFNARLQLATPVELASHAPTRTADGRDVVVQSFESARDSPVDRVCIVLDGSIHMRPYFGAVATAIHGIDSSVEVQLLLAADETHDLSDDLAERGGKNAARSLRREIKRLAGRGGMDNVPTLVDAIERNRFLENTAVVWLHGPQFLELESKDAVWAQLAEAPDIRAYDVQIGVGPNRITEEFSANGFHPVLVRHADRELAPFLQQLINGRSSWSRQFSIDRADSESEEQSEARSPLVDLWAHYEVDRLLRADYERNRDEAIEVAESHHIVSPVTGAVVLETDQQFEDAGLTPVDAKNKAINTPEPSSATLGLFALISLWAYARRRRLV